MCPEIRKINGKEYLVDEKGHADPIEEPKPGETPADAPPADAPADDDIDGAAEKAAEKVVDVVMSKLPLEKLTKALEALNEHQTKVTPKAKDLFGNELTKEAVDKMTGRQKIVKFFQAAVQGDHVTLKALAEGTDGAGGYLFPDEFRSEVIRDIMEKPSMRSLVRTITMTRDVMKIPTLTSGPRVSWTEENAEKSTTTAQFSQATLTVKKMAAILYASDELIEDSADIDVVDLIVTLFAEAIQREEDKVIVAGNGTTQPTGLLTAVSASTIASVTCSGNLSFDNMINLEYALPAKYHTGAVFLSHRNNIRELRKLKDSNNRYYWMEPVAVGQPATFHGYPVIEQNDMSEATILFGDFKLGYWLGDRKKMSVKITQDTETAFTHDQTGIRVVERIAGNVVLADAIKALASIP